MSSGLWSGFTGLTDGASGLWGGFTGLAGGGGTPTPPPAAFATLTVIGPTGVISNGGLTAASPGGDFISAGAPNAAKTTGKYYFEVAGVIADPSSGGEGISVGLTTQDLTGYFGDAMGGATRFVNGAIYSDGANRAVSQGFQATGAVAGCCVNIGAGLVYYRIANAAWSVGYPITTGGAPVMPGVTVNYAGDTLTCRFDPASWTQAPIDGTYGPWTLN